MGLGLAVARSASAKKGKVHAHLFFFFLTRVGWGGRFPGSFSAGGMECNAFSFRAANHHLIGNQPLGMDVTLYIKIKIVGSRIRF
jgi:hypothetical protein